MQQLSRNAQVLKYFAQQYPGIPRKRLVKMAFLADLVARQYLGAPISKFTYVVYHFGPYDPEVPNTIAELESAGLAWSRESRPATDDDVAFKRLYDSGTPAVFDFTLGENEVLAYVVRNFLSMEIEELVEDVVYPSAPYQAALGTGKFNERIPMEIVDRKGLGQVGFDLEKAIKAERQVEEGHFLTAQDYFDGLRDRISARYPD